MKTFNLISQVTVSAYTKVEAETLEEAIKTAEHRELMTIVKSGTHTELDSWMIDELDGLPENIEEE